MKLIKLSYCTYLRSYSNKNIELIISLINRLYKFELVVNKLYYFRYYVRPIPSLAALIVVQVAFARWVNFSVRSFQSYLSLRLG